MNKMDKWLSKMNKILEDLKVTCEEGESQDHCMKCPWSEICTAVVLSETTDHLTPETW